MGIRTFAEEFSFSKIFYLQAAGAGGREKWEPVWGKFHIANRIGDISEVAAAVTFLASRDAAFINATDLKVKLKLKIKLKNTTES